MKRAICTFFALTCCVCSSSAPYNFPPAVIPPQPTASDWPDVGAVILDDSAILDYHFSGNGSVIATLEHRRRMKILSKNGLAQGVIELPVDAFSTVTRVDAQAVSPDGEVTRFHRGDIEVVPWPGLGEAHDLKILRIKVPEVEVGGLIDLAYERVYVDVDFVPPWVFTQKLPVLRSQLSIVAASDIKVEARTGVGLKANENEPLRRTSEDGRERLVFVQTNLSPVFHEPDAPHVARIGPWVIPVVTNVGGQRATATWEDVRRKVESMYAVVGGGAGGSGSPESRYAQVRDALHGIDIRGLGSSELAISKPRTGPDLMEGAPACTRDASAVLMDALAGSGLPAYPALLTGPVGPPLLEGFPGFYPFVRAVVAVDVSSRNAADPSCTEDPESRGLLCAVPQESYAFVDPLCRFCRFGELPSAFAGGRALVFLPEKARWVDVPVDTAERNHTITEFRYAFEVDGRMHGNMAGQVVGAKARAMRSELPEDGAQDRLRQIMRDAFIGAEGELKFSKVGISNPFSADKPLAVSGQLETHAQKEDDELYSTRVVDFAGPVLADRFRSLRRYDALLDAPAVVDAHVEIELPVSYAVGEPLPEVRMDAPFAAYASGFVVQDRKLAYSRRLILKQHQMDAETYEQFRDFLDEIATAEGAAIRIGLVDEPPPAPPEPVKKKTKGKRKK